ncbi:MAG TPA: polysaccharide deacetylase [Steroidobacteraceae bacterium]|nr:polysaccharide deacetylase [Steroidobacteraceae bacterium]
MSAQNDLSACITFDFDAMSVWIGSAKSNNPSMISRGEFAAIAVPRLLKLLRTLSARASFCIPGHTACAYPDQVKAIRDDGHEIVHHGWVHENPADFDPAGEKRILERGFEGLHRAAGVKPVGYRSPAWDLSPATVDLLIEYGFLYDSSCMGNDFYPYYLRSGDRWSKDDPYQFGRTTSLVELPVTWGLDDFPAFEFVMGLMPGYNAPSAIREIWQGDFDYALANCPGGIFNLTLHPEVIARGHRIMMLEKLLRYMADQRGVTFRTMGEYAADWKSKHSVESWTADHPDATGARSIRSL